VNSRGVVNRDLLIHDSNRRTGPTLAIIAVIVNIITVPIGIALWEKVFQQGNAAAAFGFVFPLIGLLALIWAGRKILRLLFHGSTTFELVGGKGTIGGTLKGTVSNSRKSKPFDALVARLLCKRKVRTGSADSSSTHTTAIWEGSREVSRGRANLREGVSIEIAIPGTLPESDDSDADSIVFWELLVEAPVRPINFLAQFRVPVFRKQSG